MNTLHPLSQALASQGRYGDSTLVHMNPQEVSGLQALARNHGTTLTTNPETGLPEAFNLRSLLPIAAGLALGPAGLGMTALQAGMLTGGATALMTGSPMQGLQAGLGGYGGAGMGAGFSAAGAPTFDAATMGYGASPPPEMIANLQPYSGPTVTPTFGENMSQTFKGVGDVFSTGDAGTAARTKFMEGIGGGTGLAKYGGSMAASSLMGDDKGEELSGPEYYMRPYDLDITNISGTYDPYESSRERDQLRYNFRARDPIRVAQGGAIRYQDGGTVSPSEANVYRNISNVQQMAGMPMTEVQAMMSARSPFTSYENYNPGTMRPFEAPPMMGSNVGDGFRSQRYDVPTFKPEDSVSFRDIQEKERLKDQGYVDDPFNRPAYDPSIGGYSRGGAVRYQEGGLAAMMSPEEAMTPPMDGRFLRGDGDGMSDEITATIEGEQDALLSDGEFVIPADIVSHLGNGSSEAGAKILYQMMDRVRRARTGQKEQAEEIDVEEFLPA